MMKQIYLIELGGEKERYEMESLELNNIDDALEWIQGNMESDSEYFNVDIKSDIYVQKHFHNKAIVYINAETIVTAEMSDSKIYSVETIIESNLSVVSRIIAKGELKEVSE